MGNVFRNGTGGVGDWNLDIGRAKQEGDGHTGECVLVCGGAGYIGSHVVYSMAGSGFMPVVLDNLSTGHRQSIPDGVPLVVGSIGDRAQLDKVFAEYDVGAVVHLCAHAYVGESVKNPRKYYHNNIFNGLVLLEAMIDHGVQRIVFSSSCTVYGHPERIPIDEDCSVQPISPYGRTKAMFEQMLSDFERGHGLRWIALRYFNAAGASTSGLIGEDHDPEPHLIPLVLRQALCLRYPNVFPEKIPPLTVFGDDYDTVDGTCIRDYIHVLDLSQAHLLALQHLAADGRSMALNLGNQRGYSVKDVIAVCGEISGERIPFEIGPRRPGDPAELVGCADRAKEVFGWMPRHSDIESIVKTAWNWHLHHPTGFGEQ